MANYNLVYLLFDTNGPIRTKNIVLKINFDHCNKNINYFVQKRRGFTNMILDNIL